MMMQICSCKLILCLKSGILKYFTGICDTAKSVLQYCSQWSLLSYGPTNHVCLPNKVGQRTLTVRGSITAWLVSSFTRLHQTASLNTNKIIFSSLVSSSLVKLETSRTVILPPTVSVLWVGSLLCHLQKENNHNQRVPFSPISHLTLYPV